MIGHSYVKIQGIFAAILDSENATIFMQTALPPLPALNIIEPQFLPLEEQNLPMHFLDASGGLCLPYREPPS